MIETITIYVILIADTPLLHIVFLFFYVMVLALTTSDYLHTYLLPPESTDREKFRIGFAFYAQVCQIF